jgi:hypothetical protein
MLILIERCVSADANIALGKPVSMSSVWDLFSASPSEAVDGNRSGNVVMTRYQSNPWIRIDFLKRVLLPFLTYICKGQPSLMKNTHVFHMWFTCGIGTITCGSHMIHM